MSRWRLARFFFFSFSLLFYTVWYSDARASQHHVSVALLTIDPFTQWRSGGGRGSLRRRKRSKFLQHRPRWVSRQTKNVTQDRRTRGVWNDVAELRQLIVSSSRRRNHTS